jgi:hypothetical protein
MVGRYSLATYRPTLYFVLASDGWTLVLFRFTVGRSDAISYELGPSVGRHIGLVHLSDEKTKT